MGWLIALVLLLLWLGNRSRVQRLQAELTRSQDEARSRMGSGQGSQLSAAAFHELVLLRLELGRCWAAGYLSDQAYAHLTERIDTLWAGMLAHLGAEPETEPWGEGRQAAWALLGKQVVEPLGAPPWESAPSKDRQLALELPAPQPDRPQQVEDSPRLSPVDGAKEGVGPHAGLTEMSASAPAELELTLAEDTASDAPREPDETTRFAWQPATQSPLERALQAVSGWSRAISPFLVQNIGWFIGGFSFVAGSVFLVAYTTGFGRALIVAAVVFGYALLLLGGGYQLRRHQVALRTASAVVLTLGMLLIPLSIAASIRLLEAGLPAAVTTVVGILVVALNLGVFYWAAQLASGLMDRSLQGPQARLFLALAVLQLGVPVLARVPHWPLLALLHLLLLGLLGYGLARFIHDWLRSIFLEQRKLASYAAGTLVYAALVSFVHLTWGYAGALPNGYFGPFVMALSGLLFYVDAQFKAWTRQHAYLSRFSFAVYGLSVLALAMCFDAPQARLVTLALAIAVYATVLWRYLTLPPLYLLLACLAWLYALLVLQHTPAEAHFIVSLPGLAGLWALYRWALRRRAGALALLSFRVLLMLALGLAIWSLVHAEPGLVGAITGGLVTGLGYLLLGHVPPAVCSRAGWRSVTDPALAGARDLRATPWFYLVALAGVLTLAHAPVWTSLGWAEQFVIGTLVLASWWTWSGLKRYSEMTEANRPRVEVRINSALLSLLIALAVGLLKATATPHATLLLPLLLAGGGGVLLWQALRLPARGLFYGALLLGAAAAVLVKLTWFPGPSAGLAEMLVAFSAWVLLWRLERRLDGVAALRLEPHPPLVTEPPLVVLFGRFPIPRRTLAETLYSPLRQLMVIIWALGLLRLGSYWYVHGPSLAWLANAGLATLTTAVLLAYFRMLWLWPAPLLLGFATVHALFGRLLGLDPVVWTLLTVLYALLAWLAIRALVVWPQTLRLTRLLRLSGGHGTRGGRQQVEHASHWTALAISLVGLSAGAAYGLEAAALGVLPTLGVGLVFLWLAGQRYRQQLHGYALLFVVVAGLLVLLARVASIGQARELLVHPWTGLSLSLLGLAMAVLAHVLERRARSPAVASIADLYRAPLQVVGAGLALLGGSQQLALLGFHAATGVSPLIVVVLVLASLGLVMANTGLRSALLSLLGIVFASLALVGSQAVLFHGGEPFALWPGQAAGDQWIGLALLSLGWASLAQFLAAYPRWRALYAQPLWVVAAVSSAWVLLEAIPHLVRVLGGEGAGHDAPWLFLILGLVLAPLLQPFAQAARWRGVGVLVLLTALLVSTLALPGFPGWVAVTQVLWAYTLWILANLALPRFNRRWPQWAVDAGLWPWFGLLVLGWPVAAGEERVMLFGPYWLAVAIYLFLLLRNGRWSGWPWLAVGMLTGVGVYFAGQLSSEIGIAEPVAFVLGTLMWSNLLLRLVPWWRRFGEAVTARLAWQDPELSAPLLTWPYLVFCCGLVVLILTDLVAGFLPGLWGVSLPSLLVIAGVLAASFLHRLYLEPGALYAHSLLAAVFALFLMAWSVIAQPVYDLPLFLTLWSGVLFLTHFLWERRGGRGAVSEAMFPALGIWLNVSPWFALFTLPMTPSVSLAERLLTVGLLAALLAGLGQYRQRRGLLLAASLLALVLLHGWPLLWVSVSQVDRLLPWYALQIVSLAWLGLLLQNWLERRSPASAGVLKEWPRYLSVLPLLALGEWAFHAMLLIHDLALGQELRWLSPGGDRAAALLAAGLLVALGVRQLRRSQRPEWIYGVALLAGALGVYLRLWWVGLAPIQIGDTVALLGAAYGLFVLLRLTRSPPLEHISVLLSLLALWTAPAQMASVHAAGTCLAAGTLYLSLHMAGGKSLYLYLGVLAVNAAIYLWVPAWAEQYQLLQLYAVPAALSVLLLAHLHRRELKRGVLNGTRLAAVCTLYASATLDVFLRPELSIFVLALTLSLAGVILGITTRIRAFLYGGAIFLVMNVLGQLIRFYPEQRLGKAILLMLLGATVTAGMIGFNLKREAALRRIRIYRADLEAWD